MDALGNPIWLILSVGQRADITQANALLTGLKDSGVDFVCADIPDANTLTIGIFATLAQHERELIGDRTKKALAAKKQQGFQLGSPQNLKMWQSSELSFKEVLEKLRPEVLIVLGYSLWQNLPRQVSEGPSLLPAKQGLTRYYS